MASGIRPYGKPVGSGQLKLLTAVREENQMFGINVARGVSELLTILFRASAEIFKDSQTSGGGWGGGFCMVGWYMAPPQHWGD